MRTMTTDFELARRPDMPPLTALGVLDCGDGVCAVAAFGAAGRWPSTGSQSGDFVPPRRDHRSPKPGGVRVAHGKRKSAVEPAQSKKRRA